MEARQLMYFVAVAENHSFSQASRLCFLTQSAISQQIKSLEEELGTELFHRTQHYTTLTEAGEELLPYARRVIKSMKDVKEHMSQLNGMLCGKLTIGIGSFIEPYIRMAACKFMEKHPNVQLNLVYSKPQLLNRALKMHELDLAFTMNTAYNDEGIESVPAIPFHLSAIMKTTHPLARMDKVSLEDVQKHKVIMPDAGTRPLETIRRYSGLDIEKLKISVIVNAPDAALNLVQETNGITFLPSLYVQNRPMLCARPIEGLEMELMSNAHWLTDTSRKKSAEAFLKIIKEDAVPWCTNMG